MKSKFLFLFSLVMIGLSFSTAAQKKKHYHKHYKKHHKSAKVHHSYAPPAPRVVLLPPPPRPVIIVPPHPPRPRVRH